MGSVKLKICGLHPNDALDFTAHPVVTHIGLIFVKASKRYVTPTQAQTIVDGIDTSCSAVGVFTNHTILEILKIRDQTGITVAQLHGDESPEFCDTLRKEGLKVWKSISISINAMNDMKKTQEYIPYIDGVVLDAAPPKNQTQVLGGHGHTFDWDILKQFSLDNCSVPIWIAGGLTPENVGQLMSYMHPYGVDVSSGVEINGRKSVSRIQAMIEAVDNLG